MTFTSARSHATAALGQLGLGQPQALLRAPGRVNILGEHTDYNDGLCLPVAIDREIVVAMQVRAADAQQTTLSLASVASTGDRDAHEPVIEMVLSRDSQGLVLPDDVPSWVRLAVAVLDSVERALGEHLGNKHLSLAVGSSLPEGAGLSSSAAFEVAVAMAVCEAGGWSLTGHDLVDVCRRAEHLGLGVPCGLLDQTAIVFAEAGQAIRFDNASRNVESVALPADCGLIICDTGVTRQLAESGYARRVEECQRACEILGMRSLRQLEGAGATIDSLPETLDRRVHHVLTENERVRAAASVETTAELGRLVLQSHASLRDDYEVSVPAADDLVEVLTAAPGVSGARLIGAGFGGSVLAVANLGTASETLEWINREVPEARPLLVTPAAGAGRLPL